MLPPGTAAAIYARVSPRPAKKSKVGGVEPTTTEEQTRICRAVCDQKGWRVRYVLADRLESAKDLNRPNFQRLMEHVEAGRVGVVVVWKLDRMWRSLRDTVNVFEFFRECGVAFHSCTEPFDNTSPFGRFVFRNVASAAELERELIRERTQMALHWRAREGIWLGRAAPFGYDRADGGSLAINKPEARVVKVAFGIYLRLRSMEATADALNAAGHRSRNGQAWTQARIQRVLSNPIYAGRMVIAGVEHNRPELRIVPQTAFDSAAKIRVDTSRRPPRDDGASRQQEAIRNVFGQYEKGLAEMEKAGELAAEDPLASVLAGMKGGD